PQGQVLAGDVAVRLAQLRGDGEGEGDGVVGEPVDRGHPEPVEAGHHSSLKWSNGSRQARHRRSALHAVEEKRLSSSVSAEPQCGQLIASRGSAGPPTGRDPWPRVGPDRKSTRLNSS